MCRADDLPAEALRCHAAPTCAQWRPASCRDPLCERPPTSVSNRAADSPVISCMAGLTAAQGKAPGAGGGPEDVPTPTTSTLTPRSGRSVGTLSGGRSSASGSSGADEDEGGARSEAGAGGGKRRRSAQTAGGAGASRVVGIVCASLAEHSRVQLAVLLLPATAARMHGGGPPSWVSACQTFLFRTSLAAR